MERHQTGTECLRQRVWALPEGKRTAMTALISTAIFSFAAHGYLFTNELFSHDSISYFTYATGSFGFYTGIGRFLIPVYECLKGDVAAPWLIGLLFIFWMSAASWITAQLLQIRSAAGVILTSGLFCTNIALTLTGATYIYCMDEYAFALFAAVLAVWLFTRGGRWMVPGVAVLVISLAMYQAYFTVAAGLCFLLILQRLTKGESCKAVVPDGVRYLGLLAVSFVVYYGIWGLVCNAVGVAKRRVEESFLSGGGLAKLVKAVAEANLGYIRGLFGGSGVLDWLMLAVHAALVVLLVWRLVQILRREDLAVSGKILLVLLVCLIPTAFNSVSILLAGSANRLTTFAWELFYVLPVLCREPAEGKAVKPAMRTAALVLLCCVLWQHTVYANQVYMKKELDKSATISLATRMIDRVEQVEGYVPGETPVAFAGRLDRNEYLNRGRDEFAALDTTVGLWSDYSATYNMGRYLTDYLNYPLNWDTVTDFDQHSRVQAMPVFPAAGAIQMIDGTVVIKLS